MMPRPDVTPRFVFVGGLHRSGTTLLAQLLAEHPDVSGLRDTPAPHDEGQHLQDVVPTASALGGPGRFAHQRGAHLTEADTAAVPDAAARLLAAWSPFADPGCPVWVEKSPPNLLRFRFLRAVFPDCACVAIVRHPIAVAQASEFWAGVGIGALLEHWLFAHETFEADRAHLDDVVVVRYEDLVADPAAALAAVDRGCGLAPHTASLPVQAGTNARYLRRFRHHRFVPAALRIAPLVRRYEARLAALGYGYSLRDRGV